MTAPELLPCPFCGGSASQHSHQKGSPSGWEFDCDHWICCETEDCLVHVGMCETPEQAIAAWNRRAALADSPEVQRMIREAEARGRVEGMERAAEATSLNSWKHEGDDAYSKGMDAGARHQAKVIYDAIRAAIKGDTK